MKILSLSNCRLDRLLGSGRTRHAWADGLTALGHEVTLVDSEALLGAAEHRPTGRRARLTVAAWRWLSTLDLAPYDLVEFYGSEFWLATQQLARRPRRCRPFLVAHTDGLELLMSERLAASGDPAARRPAWKEAPARLLAPAERLAFSRADGFVAGCRLDCEYLKRLGTGAPMEVVPIGIDPAYLDLPLETGGREERVAFVGSWIPRKGVRHLSAVMTSLLHARPRLMLDLFGRDHDDDVHPLTQFPADVHAQIVVHPRVDLPTLIAALQRAKVFFFPSEYEGFGLGLAEAMACGLAAVTTPTGFGAELRDGEEALVCGFGDVRAMQAAIARLLDEDSRRVELAANGWRRVQTLRWETSVQRLDAIYRRWVTEGKSYVAS